MTPLPLDDTRWRDLKAHFGKTSRIYGLSREEARRSLCKMDDAPAEWLARTRLDEPAGELAFRAAHTLAWWSSISTDELARGEG